MLTIALAGLAALAKVVVAMEDGAIPANLHYQSPNPNILGLQDGRLKVVSERTPWQGGYVGINSFGFGGSNVHCLLKSHSKPRPAIHTAERQTRMVTYAGRTQEAVESLLTYAQTEGLSVEQQALLQDQAVSSPASMPYRGYTLVNVENAPMEVQVSEMRWA